MTQQKRASVLAGRIAAGKADPISAEEREIVAGLRASYAKKYGSGNEQGANRSSKNLRSASLGRRGTAYPSQA